MKNKELNIAEILKDCPKGMKLYSTAIGECTFEGVTGLHIKVRADANHLLTYLTTHGKMFDIAEAECLLFPSKENRDWSTFKAPKKEHEFKPFEKVLVRDLDDEKWHADFFSHMRYGNRVSFGCVGRVSYQCVPYEGNEHLLGTTDSPDVKGGKQ